MTPSWLQILIVVAIVVILFGRGRIADLMSDMARGIRSFRKGLEDEPQDSQKDSQNSKKDFEDKS